MNSNNIEKHYFYVFGVCLLFVMPFILNDLQYRDDWYRTAGFIDGWAINGRHLSNYLFNVITLKFHGLSDIAPLPSIMAVAIAAWSIVFAFRLSSFNNKPLYLIAFSCLFISPFYIQNIAYRYDILPMTISASLAIFALVVASMNSSRYSYCYAVLMIATAFSLYQVGNNIFIALCALNMMYGLWGERSKSLTYSFKMAMIYVSGFLLYSFFTYVILDSKVDRTDTGTLYTFIDAFKNAYTYGIKSFYIDESKPFIIIMTLCFAINTCYRFLISKTVHEKIALVAGFIALIFSILGLVSLLKEGYTSLRVLMGANVLYFAIVLSTFILLERIYCAKFILPIICLICPFVFSYALASATKVQRDYELTIVNSIYSNMDSKNINGKYKTMYVAGPMPLSPIAKRSGEHYKAISPLISPSFPWVSRWMLRYYGVDNVLPSPHGDPEWIKEKVRDLNVKPEVDGRWYSIYIVEGNGLIWFK